MSLKRLWLLALCVPFMAFAAAENPPAAPADASGTDNETEFRLTNPQIDTWAVGVISQAGKDGKMTVRIVTLPFATAHAQMRQEMQKKLAGVDDPQQRAQIVKQTKDAWREKLNKAIDEKRGAEKEVSFKQPADKDDLVVLNGKAFRDLPAMKRAEAFKERREKMDADERSLADLYHARSERVAARRADQPQFTGYDADKLKAAAEKVGEKGKERVEAGREKLAGERMSASDLKAGDKVLIGYDADTDTAFTIILKDDSK